MGFRSFHKKYHQMSVLDFYLLTLTFLLVFLVIATMGYLAATNTLQAERQDVASVETGYLSPDGWVNHPVWGEVEEDMEELLLGCEKFNPLQYWRHLRGIGEGPFSAACQEVYPARGVITILSESSPSENTREFDSQVFFALYEGEYVRVVRVYALAEGQLTYYRPEYDVIGWTQVGSPYKR